MARTGLFVGSSYVDDDDFSRRNDDARHDDDDRNHRHHHTSSPKGCCVTYWALRSICVTVTAGAVTNGSIAGSADTSWHSEAGCEAVPQALRAATVPASFSFSSSVPHGVSSYGFSQVPPSGMRGPLVVSMSTTLVTVQSGEDPYVEALRITNGHPGSFGLTRGTQFALAVAFFVIGGIGCLVPIGVVCWVRACI